MQGAVGTPSSNALSPMHSVRHGTLETIRLTSLDRAADFAMLSNQSPCFTHAFSEDNATIDVQEQQQTQKRSHPRRYAGDPQLISQTPNRIALCETRSTIAETIVVDLGVSMPSTIVDEIVLGPISWSGTCRLA